MVAAALLKIRVGGARAGLAPTAPHRAAPPRHVRSPPQTFRRWTVRVRRAAAKTPTMSASEARRARASTSTWREPPRDQRPLGHRPHPDVHHAHCRGQGGGGGEQEGEGVVVDGARRERGRWRWRRVRTPTSFACCAPAPAWRHRDRRPVGFVGAPRGRLGVQAIVGEQGVMAEDGRLAVEQAARLIGVLEGRLGLPTAEEVAPRARPRRRVPRHRRRWTVRACSAAFWRGRGRDSSMYDGATARAPAPQAFLGVATRTRFGSNRARRLRHSAWSPMLGVPVAPRGRRARAGTGAGADLRRAGERGSGVGDAAARPAAPRPPTPRRRIENGVDGWPVRGIRMGHETDSNRRPAAAHARLRQPEARASLRPTYVPTSRSSKGLRRLEPNGTTGSPAVVIFSHATGERAHRRTPHAGRVAFHGLAPEESLSPHADDRAMVQRLVGRALGGRSARASTWNLLAAEERGERGRGGEGECVRACVWGRRTVEEAGPAGRGSCCRDRIAPDAPAESVGGAIRPVRVKGRQ